MSRFNIPGVARGLTTYAIERQHGFERHQPDGLPLWAEQRRFWTDAILQGMARLEGEDAGPHCASGFVSGAVTDAGIVKQTPVYQEAVRKYPEVTDWPALCTVYVGRDLPSALGTVDASDFDLKIMTRTGDRFLKAQGVHCVGSPYQMTVAAAPKISAQNEPPQAEEQASLLIGPAMG